MEKLHNQSTLSDVERMYRYSMLNEQAEIVYKLVTREMNKSDIDELEDELHEGHDNSEIIETLDGKSKELDKLISLIEEELTEKQFLKLEEVVKAIKELSDELSYY